MSLHRLALIALTLAMLHGCGSDDAIIGVEVPNTPPETQVTATPPVLTQTGYTVRFFWSGTDSDGTIERFVWRISDNGADGMVDVADTLGLAWNYTEATDSTFVVTADMSGFPADVANGALTAKSWRFWQTHTFFIRAIDDRGGWDPTAANVSFTATTIAPVVSRTLPGGAITPTCTSGPLALAFGWEAVDPDNPAGEPEFIRYKLIPYDGGPSETCMIRQDFERSTIFQDAQNIPWSRWIRYDAPLDSGKIVRFSPQGVESGDIFLFAVQAKDIAGAITPTFDWGINVWHVKASANKFPELSVSERYLGGKIFRAIGGVQRFAIVSKQPLEFTWSGSAEAYGGLIEGFKYGFDLADPDDPNDEGWFVDWGIGTNWQRSLPRTFSQGSPNFVAQVRDNSGTISRALYQFQVIQIAQRSEQETLLFVDDRPENATDDARSDAGWKNLLSGVQTFQFANHSIDADREPIRLTFALVNEYKAVVWYTGASTATFLASQLAPRSSADVQFNWLEIYQRFVGNVMLVGPAAMWRSIEYLPFSFPIVLNSSDGTDNGLFQSMGVRRLPDGSLVNRGVERYPYTAFCLESIDLVRPPGLGNISGELTGRNLRTSACDGLAFARVSPDFVSRFGTTPAQVANLLPTEARLARPVGGQPGAAETNALQLDLDEFYNVNVTTRAVSLNLRPCQTPMFLHIARSDIDEAAIMDPSQADPKDLVSEADSLYYSLPQNAGYRLPAQPRRVAIVNDPADQDPSDGIDRIKDCGWARYQRRKSSLLTGSPVAIASSAFADAGSKQDGQVTTSDFLFGFNPFGFQQGQMGITVSWILETYWNLNQ